MGFERRVRTSRRAGRRGVILIITLWVLVILASVALSYAYYARLDLQMTSYNSDSARARYLAKAGYYRTCVYLRDDKLKDQDLLDNEDLVELEDDDRGYLYDAMNEEWYSIWWDEDEEDHLKRVPFGKGSFRVHVIDESGKININIASQELLQDLLEVTGVEEKKAQAISAAIVDWRDEDDEPSDGGEEGFGEMTTEDTYYNPDQNLRDIEAQGPDYVNKNAPFDDVEELLLVWEMTPTIFFGEDTNGNGKLDPNERDGRASPPDDDGDDKLLLGIQPYVTVYSERALNINTAPQKVLEACLRSYDEGEAEELAEDIVEYRLGSDDEPGTRDDRPFRTLDDSDEDDYDLSAVRSLGPDGAAALRSMIPLSVASDVFTIESIGEVNGVERKLVNVMQRMFTEPLELEGEAMEEWKRREEEEEQPEAVEFFVLRSSEEGV